jgi:hypothetical protein
MKPRGGDLVTHVLEDNVEKEVVKLLVTAYTPSQRLMRFYFRCRRVLCSDLGHTRGWRGLDLHIQGGALIVHVLAIWRVIAHITKNR